MRRGELVLSGVSNADLPPPSNNESKQASEAVAAICPQA